MDANELKEIGRRPVRYWNQDGIADMCSGVFFLLIGGQFWAFHTGNILLAFSIMGTAYLFFFLFGKKAVVRAKERWVFPRTGRIELRRQKGLDWRKGLIAWAGGMALCAFVVLIPVDVERWMPAATGLLFTGCLIGLGAHLRLRRHFATGALTLALTVLTAAGGWRGQGGMAVIMFGTGAILLFSGAIALAAFLRSAPLAPQE